MISLRGSSPFNYGRVGYIPSQLPAGTSLGIALVAWKVFGFLLECAGCTVLLFRSCAPEGSRGSTAEGDFAVKPCVQFCAKLCTILHMHNITHDLLRSHARMVTISYIPM